MAPHDAAAAHSIRGASATAAQPRQLEHAAQALMPAPVSQHQPHREPQPSQPSVEPVPDLLTLPQYAPFTAPDFNAGEWTSRVLTTSRTSAAAQADELRGGVRSLEGALAAAVLARHGELLGHAWRLTDAEAGAGEVAAALGSLQAAVRRVRAEVEAPYAVVRTQTRQLAALHAAGELLRALLARLKATAKLRAALDAPPAAWDLAKAAKLLSEVGPPAGGPMLSGVALAAEDAPFLEQAGAAVRDAAHALLSEGMAELSQAKVGSALQVFYNLGELAGTVDGLVARAVADLDRAARSALDSRHLSLSLGAAAKAGAAGPGGARGVNLPQPGAAGSWQEKLWQGVRGVADTLVSGGAAVWHLQRVAAKKRDPVSHSLLLDEVVAAGRGETLTDKYWYEALRVLDDALATASRPAKGGFVREALTAGYPQLVSALETAFARLQQDTCVKGVPPAVVAEQLPELLGVAAPFRDAYLAAALGRLQDMVNAAFPGGGRTLPSPAECQKCIAVMADELRAAGASGALAGQVAGVVGKALQLLAQRAEYMAAAGPELKAVALAPGAGGASPAQQRNIALASQLQEVHRSLLALLPRLPDQVAGILDIPLAGLHATALDAVAPLFRGLVDSLEAKLAGMHASHAAHWARGAAPPSAGVMDTSSYIAEVASCLSVFRSEFLSRFSPAPALGSLSAVSQLCERSAGRLLTFFVRHAALLRPLPPPAKLQLAKDLAELQAAVGQSLWPLEALAPAIRCLRAFRALLFVEDAALDAGLPPLRGLPPSVALHHLFSRLPPQVQAPHERSALTPVQYSRWLDQHSEADVVRGVQGALETAQPAPAANHEQEHVLAVMAAVCAATRQVPAVGHAPL